MFRPKKTAISQHVQITKTTQLQAMFGKKDSVGEKTGGSKQNFLASNNL